MREGWKLRKLGELGECSIGLTYSPADVSESGGTLVLRSSNIRDGRIVYGDDVFVSSAVPESARVRKGDILICVRNGSRNLIGKCALIDDTADGHAFGAFMAVFRGDNNDFIYQLFQTDAYRQQIRKQLGATINQITNKTIRNFEFPIPPLSERPKIIKVLCAWDEALEKLRRLITAKETQFRSLRRLLTWNIHASGHQQWFKLGYILTIAAGRVGDGRALRVFSVTKDGLVPQDEQFKKRIANDDISRHMLVRYGDFTLSGLNFWMGSVDVSLEEDEFCISPDYKVFSLAQTVEPRFFRHLIRTEDFKRILRNAAVERASVVRRNFDRETFLESEIPYSSLARQIDVARVLDAAETEIRILRDQLKTVEKQKRGLMQKLLAGELQVQLHDNAAVAEAKRGEAAE